MADLPDSANLERRLQRIEQHLGLREAYGAGRSSRIPALWPFGLGLGSLVFGCLGLGLPAHYYQFLFSGLVLLLLYHRGSLRPAPGRWKWPLIVLNFLLLCLLFKLLIGGGVVHPLDWIKLPGIVKNPPAGDQAWYSRALPDYAVQWQAIPGLAEWSIDVTRLQTLLFVVVFAGALFRFEPFTSVVALGLLVVSLPSYFHYDWNQVILFTVCGSVSLYLQSGAYGRTGGRGARCS